MVGDPIAEGLVQLSESLGKKVIPSGDDDELPRLGEVLDEIPHFVPGSEGVSLTLNE
jgi:hypothetical protein